MKKKFLSNVCFFLGFVLILSSAVIFFQSNQREKNAEASIDNVLNLLKEKKTDFQINPLQELIREDENEEILIDENLYSFVLKIPSLNLELPVQSSWSYAKLDVSPCIYKEEPLSIAAHNFKSHFGNLIKLKSGDKVIIENFSGEIFEYSVVSISEISENDIEKLENFDYDLSLFTCNYLNNNNRILVRLNLD